ncbi:MAG: glutathione S-transferase N-terminal domain-containing protein [Burkholderiaceae bacterium]|nr:glutathione S-transferase N-terminal domain-containing protein [Burkholderiaceae bacterium]
MKLIGSLTSPYVRKARIVMAEKKLDYRLELENVWASDATIQQFNPLGKVPCLVMEDGGSLFDSRVIVEYLDTLSPVSRLIPQQGRDRAAVKCWESIADGVLDACVTVVKEKQRPPSQQSPEWIERQMGKVSASLAAMDAGLGEHAYCMGVNYSLADIAVGCALGYLDLRFAELAWRDGRPNLARLFEKLSTRQSFVDTVPATV